MEEGGEVQTRLLCALAMGMRMRDFGGNGLGSTFLDKIVR